MEALLVKIIGNITSYLLLYTFLVIFFICFLFVCLFLCCFFCKHMTLKFKSQKAKHHCKASFLKNIYICILCDSFMNIY